MRILPNLKIHIEDSEVVRYLGAPSIRTPLPYKDLIENAKKEAHFLIKPKGMYRLVDSKLLPHISIFEGTLRGVFAICTIGSSLEERVSELMAGEDRARGLILDAIGTTAVESAANQVNFEICNEAEGMGFKTTPRISPGYRGWGLEGQRLIFENLDGSKIGVKLLDSLMMHPRKSISFAVGFISEDRQLPFPRCVYCGFKDCPFRRET